jgi:CRISPR system Cascade subunit CasD
MQSWGTRSQFDERDTDLEPSKSGVLGLVCAALGRDRSENVDDLASLRMGVRVDRQGMLRHDYQTAGRVLRADLSGTQETVESRRYYLADAVFLVGLEGSDVRFLEQIHLALRDPHWPQFLGRKSYVPSRPVWLTDGLSDHSLEIALATYPPLVEPRPPQYRFVIEASEGAVVRMDQPVSPFAARKFGARQVRIEDR